VTLVAIICVQTAQMATSLLLAETEVVIDKSHKTVNVFIEMLDVVMSCPLNPQRLYGM